MTNTISSTCYTSTQDVVDVSLRSELESGAVVQLSYEVSEKLFSLSSLAPQTYTTKHFEYIAPWNTHFRYHFWMFCFVFILPTLVALILSGPIADVHSTF